MTEPPRKVAVLLNRGAHELAGKDASAVVTRISAALAASGISSSVEVSDGAGLPEAVGAAAAAADAIVVGGGDGSLGAAAGRLAGGRVPLGVLPLGTLNHFARDLGIPSDLAGALRTIAEGHVRSVDVGDVNGRVFLNNSSVGLYPELVKGREELQQRAGLGKWLAMIYAAASVLRRFPLLTVALESGGERVLVRTPFVFVGNNAYELRLLALGRRTALDRGELSLYVARHATRLSLLRLALLAAVGRLEQDRDFHSFTVEALSIDTGRRRLRVAADGELADVTIPIRYRARPRALRVLAPAVP